MPIGRSIQIPGTGKRRFRMSGVPLVISAALLLGLSGIGCSYHLRGTGSSLPNHIQSVSVPIFKNNTTRFQLDLKLTQSVIDELVARGKVEISGEGDAADAVLIGEITSFAARPIGFAPGQATADRYSIVVVAKVVLRDRVNRRVIFSNPGYVFQEEYEVPEGTDFESVETEAIDKIAGKFARSLVSTILEGF